MSTVLKIRKKPVTIEAMLYDGTLKSAREIVDWTWYSSTPAVLESEVIGTTTVLNLLVDTLEGVMRVSPGDYVVRGVQGEHYPIKADILAKSYDILYRYPMKNRRTGSC